MKNLFKRVLSIAAATALLMTSVISASADGHSHGDGTRPMGGESQGDYGENNYKITLTFPEDENIKTPDEIHLGAYQIFSGTVPAEGEDGYPEGASAYTNPGTNGTVLPITDIKWGNAFKNEDAIVDFVYALGTASDNTINVGYAYAFTDFDDFKDFVNKSYSSSNVDSRKLADKYYDASGKLNKDLLALNVAEVLAKHEKDLEWLQKFTDILGGYGTQTAEGYARPSYVSKYYEGTATGSTNTDFKDVIWVPAGYYMIKDLSGIDTHLDSAYSARMLLVASNVEQHIKASVPTLDKKILRDGEEDSPYNSDVVGVGDTVKYRLTGTLPSNYDNFIGGYKYTFTDTLSDGLDFVKGKEDDLSDTVKITVVGAYELGTKDGAETKTWNSDTKLELTTDSFLTAGVEHAGSEQHLKDKDKDKAFTVTFSTSDGGHTDDTLTVSFPCLKEIRITKEGKVYELGYNKEATGEKSSQIYVTYEATVNENAVVDPATGEESTKDLKGNKNTAQLEYSDNPQAYGDIDKTTKQIATVYTFGLDITKIDAADFIKNSTETKLEGAEFAILRKAKGVSTENTYDYATVKVVNGHFAISKWSGPDDTISGANGKALRDELNGISDISMATNASGKFEITGLDAGVEYTLVEIETPSLAGDYAFIEPITFKIEAATESSGEYNGKIENITPGKGFSTDGTVSVKESVAAKNLNEKNAGIYDFTVVNFKYTDLPSTGGIGVYIYYIAGGCVVALALVLFALSKKKKTTK